MREKTLTALALPLIVSFTLRFLFTLIDLEYLAAIEDEVPYGAGVIGMFLPIQKIFIAVWAGLSAGFTASISQAFGARDEARVRALKRGMLWLHAALVPAMGLLAAAVWIWQDGLPHVPAELRRDFLTYALIIVLTAPFSSFLSIYPDSIVKAHHDTVTTMKAGFASMLANVVLNTVFVFVFHWGVAGVAVATVLSRFAGFGYAAWRMVDLERARLAEPGWQGGDAGGSPSRGGIAEILLLALPATIAFGLLSGEEILINVLLTSTPGAALYLSAYAVHERLLSLAIMPVVATSIAVLPFVARLLPQGRVPQILGDLRRNLLLTTGLVLAIAVPCGWIFPGALMRHFMPSEALAAALDATTVYLYLLPPAALACLPYLLLRPLFEAARRPGIGVTVTMLKSLALVMPLTLLGYGIARWAGSDTLLAILIGTTIGNALASGLTLWLGRRLLHSAGEARPA